ncbi:cardiolipin synthase [Bacillus altitudinis]|uniref:cardiolipin synthase n=1 Tax=Bacillus altitudinis TaxID=293387 RepID=UPI002DB763DC|nr:cardiolipin synthase [Bacillus altitudinis]MEC3814435.1 cardiolipin synthase [Bacillus altitudinis]
MRNVVKVLFFLIITIGAYLIIQIFAGDLAVSVLSSVSVLFTLSIIFIGFVIFLENRNPSQTITWLVLLGSFPLFGFLFYIFFGRNIKKRRLFEKKAVLDEQLVQEDERIHREAIEKMTHMGDHQQLLFKLAHRLGHTPITYRTSSKVLTNGEETFSHIFEEIKKATHHIHLEYYILRHDDLGQELKDILIEKAKSGVIVRFLYDDVGSLKLSRQYIADLEKAGVQIVPFLPVRVPLLNNKINFRNHRKIVVIDGEVGFVGGLNIGDEYMGRSRQYGFWRDTHLMIKGEAVRDLQQIFMQDWYYMTNERCSGVDYFKDFSHMESRAEGVQMIAGGPDKQWEVIKNLFFSMIISAKKSIWIASPYFVPDDDILSALKIAALSGVDVRIIAPKNPDKRIVFHASRSYFPELLEAGAKVYEYDQGFMHSKFIIVDSELASIGTANMDMRSFHLNFEVNAFLYKTKSTEKLVNDFLGDLEQSHEIVPEEFAKRPLRVRLFESTARLLSPLL